MRDLFKEYGLELSSNNEHKLNLYYDILIEWNSRINLTSVTDVDDVWRTHFLDSAMLFADGFFNENYKDKSFSLLDVGSGAGFPGVVLAILRPDARVVLVDSQKKRADFLENLRDELSLDISVVCGRAEDLARNADFRESFDIVVSRAVAELRLLLELCIPFVRDDGFFVSYKGPRYAEELSNCEHAMNELSCELLYNHGYEIANLSRQLLFFSKNAPTDGRYPRRAGIPAKRPL